MSIFFLGLMAMSIVPMIWKMSFDMGGSESNLADLRMVFLYIFIILLFFSTSFFSAQVILQQDIPLLLISPTPNRQIVWARMASVSVRMLILAMVPIMVFLVGFSRGYGSNQPLFLGLVAFLINFIMASALGFFMSLLVVRAWRVGGSRIVMRTVSIVVTMAIMFSLRLFIWMASAHPGFGDMMPLSWGADLMLGRPLGSAFIAMAAVLILLGILLMNRYAVRFWTEGGDVTQGVAPRPSYREGVAVSPGHHIISRTDAIVRKEFTNLKREPEVLIRLIFLVGVLAVIPYIMGEEDIPGVLLTPFFLIMIAWTGTTILVGNTLGSDGRQLWMIKNAPLSAEEYFRGKVRYATAILTPMILAFMTISYFTDPMDRSQSLGLLILGLLIILGAPNIGVSVGTMFPDYDRATRNRPGFLAFGVISFLLLLCYLPAASMVMLGDEILADLGAPSTLRASGFAMTAILLTIVVVAMRNRALSSYRKIEFVGDLAEAE